MSAVLCKPFIIVWSVTLASGRLPIAPQVCQRLLAVELAPVMLQTFQDPFAPSPAMGLATPASQQVTSLQHNSCFHVQKGCKSCSSPGSPTAYILACICIERRQYVATNVQIVIT